jgi:hypothetical protein
MPAARLGWVLPALALALAGCGSSDRFDRRTPPPHVVPTVLPSGKLVAPSPHKRSAPRSTAGHEPVTRAEEHVIRAWAAALRHGHVARAARAFALPVIVANGDDPVELHTRAQAKAFNRSLPCGAVVVRLDRTVHHFVVSTFRLVERPGPGRCGTGVGHLARTAFLIRHGHITRWLRVADPPQDESNSS